MVCSGRSAQRLRYERSAPATSDVVHFVIVVLVSTPARARRMSDVSGAAAGANATVEAVAVVSRSDLALNPAVVHMFAANWRTSSRSAKGPRVGAPRKGREATSAATGSRRPPGAEAASVVATDAERRVGCLPTGRRPAGTVVRSWRNIELTAATRAVTRASGGCRIEAVCGAVGRQLSAVTAPRTASCVRA